MLLSHLNLLATAPGGVARLRELILTLAVQGKLVPQDPQDEPASELLKKIRAEKERLIADRKIRSSKPLESIDDSECGFVLPSNWEWERLGNLGDWGAGATPSRSNSNYYGGSIPWFKSGELRADFISESEETVTDAALRDCSLRLNQVGDVLIAMYGATIGKTAILSVVATTNQAVCACTPFVGLSNTYLLLLMKALKPYFISIGAGGAQPNISREKVVATVFGLPPFAEQSRIVTRVEELMRLCDALEAKGQIEATQHAQLVSTLLGTLTQSKSPEQLTDNWQRIATHFDLLLDRPEAVDALEQTILQLAVRGLLVPQDPRDESASELLKKIRLERDHLIAAGKIKRDKPLPPISEEEHPFAIPQGWEWVRLGSASKKITDGTHHSPANFPSGDFMYLSAKNIKSWGIDLSSATFIPKAVHDEIYARCDPAPGDILYIKDGATTGVLTINTIQEPFSLLSSVGVIKPSCGLTSDYMALVLQSPFFYQAMRDGMSGVAITRVTLSKLGDAKFPLPPLAEQSRIVTRVEFLRRLCLELRQRLITSKTTQAHLAEALVQGVD